MNIDHLAIWTNDLQRQKTFYETYFGAQASDLYSNEAKHFQSRFLTFESGCQIELMQTTNLQRQQPDEGLGCTGYAHLAFSVGSREIVDSLTERLMQDGFEKLDGPRVTGDGYYESVILDPDGNHIEITE